ncbi:hypothetical protein GH984_09260 [Spiribacter sp. C176]|uniref:AAA family ATPase n=1 Tax=Spiribacter salilacus TaxID=2664894 RepID=A0A6N7QR54_9GAMM|nr:hypothetical protein [Spiribacter salilacus]MRH78896.1 hypothetical protein [Spiribacter salilacus]
MELISLKITSLPGIAKPIEQNFEPGANFVIGPNAIGKSSLARALFFLLGNKKASDPPGLVLEARLREGDTEWLVERHASSIQWYLNGAIVEPPPLPSQEALRCYWLTAESLLPPRDADHEALHQRFREALAGGINFTQVKQHAKLEGITFPRGELNQWKAAQQKRRDLEHSYQQLQTQRKQLPQLEAKLSEAVKAANQVNRLNKALLLLQARRERLKQQQVIAGYDPRLAKLRGDEPTQAQKLVEDRKHIDQKLARLKQEQKTIQAALNETGLSHARPDPSELEAWKQSLRQIQTHRHALESAQGRLQSARDHIEHLQTQLAGDDVSAAPIISPALISQLEHAQPAQASNRWMVGLIGLGGGGSLLLGIALSNVFVLLAGTATLAGLGGLILLRSTGSKKAAKPAASINALLKTHHLSNAPYQDRGVVRWLELARDLDAAEKQAAEAQAECTSKENKISELNAALTDFLAQWHAVPSGENDTSLEAALDSLTARTSKAREQLGSLTLIQARIEDAQTQADAQDAAEAQWEALTQLDPHASAQIQALHEDHQAYQHATAQLRDYEVTEKERQRELTDQPQLIAWVEADDQAAIETALSEQTRLAESAEALQQQRSELKAEINQALGSTALSEAIAEEATIKASLEDTLTEHRMVKAGEWLLAKVEKNYQQAHEPQLAKMAKARFEAFTHGNWSLAFSENHEVVAKDLVHNKQRTLDALSSATRMQLLLAARIAWAQDQERLTRPLPFILDEALGNSDPQRFSAAVKSLEQLTSAENRQVIYLSARPEDLSLWQASAESSPHIIDLGTARTANAQPESYVVPNLSPSITAPDNQSAADYAAQLGIPGINPIDSPNGIHLFHLLRDDLPNLYTVMTDWSLRYWGPAEHWIETRKGATSEPLPTWAQTLQRRGEIAQRWQKLAQQGRGKPVNQAVLENCEAVSSTMLPRVTKVAEDCHGNAAQLIEKLNNKAVTGFRQDKIKDLEQELIQSGHLDPNPILEDEAIIQQLLATLGHRLPPEEIQTVAGWLNAARISQA